MQAGHTYGIHRVLEPAGVLPQPAWKVDAQAPLYDNELLIEVERLNIDSASFRQIREEAGDDIAAIKDKITSIVSERGKMHNPITGSGGMLIGRVKAWGPKFPIGNLQAGDRIATLVSLTLTPLRIDAIEEIDMANAQVAVKGEAILFETGIWAQLPDDLPERVALAALDVCGAPAQVAKLVQPNQRVLILGAGGKSGLLSLYQARKQAGPHGQVIALEYGEEATALLKTLSLADHVINANAQDAVGVMEQVSALTDGALCDVVINCVNVPHTEMTAILSTRAGGKIYFFSMATSFTAAALGAEGVGKDVDMMIGNGFTPGHVDVTYATLRESPAILDIYNKKFG